MLYFEIAILNEEKSLLISKSQYQQDESKTINTTKNHLERKKEIYKQFDWLSSLESKIDFISNGKIKLAKYGMKGIVQI